MYHLAAQATGSAAVELALPNLTVQPYAGSSMANLSWLAALTVPAGALAGRGVVVLALAALALPSCSDAGLRAGDAATLVAGEITAVGAEDRRRTLTAGEHVSDGARISVGEQEARLEFRAGQVWLAPGTDAVVTRDRLRVQTGDALFSSGGALGAAWGDVAVDGQGVYRMTPGFSPRLAVYRGEVEVSRPGERERVAELFQVNLVAPRLSAADAPLVYQADDVWDRRLLPRAIAFDREVAGLARGIDRQYGTAAQPASFYQAFLAVEASAIPILAETARIQRSDDAFGPPSDALLTLFVAQAGAASSGGALEETAADVADLRKAGARWGIVAQSLGIGTTELAGIADLGQAAFVAQQPVVPPAPPLSSASAAQPQRDATPSPPTAPAVDAGAPPQAPPDDLPAPDPSDPRDPAPHPHPVSPPPPAAPNVPTEPGPIERTVQGILEQIAATTGATVDAATGLLE